VTDNLIGIAGAPYPTSYRDLGIPKPATAPVITQTAAGTGDDETRFYAYTYLSDWDEEGMPHISAAVTCKPGATFDITSLAMPPSDAGETRGINRIRSQLRGPDRTIRQNRIRLHPQRANHLIRMSRPIPDRADRVHRNGIRFRKPRAHAHRHQAP
jgi:hypothetical protein